MWSIYSQQAAEIVISIEKNHGEIFFSSFNSSSWDYFIHSDTDITFAEIVIFMKVFGYLH